MESKNNIPEKEKYEFLHYDDDGYHIWLLQRFPDGTAKDLKIKIKDRIKYKIV